MNVGFSQCVLVIAVVALTLPARASVLTFDNLGVGGNNPVPQLYGDNLVNLPGGAGNPNTTYTYGTAYGTTPHIQVAYGPGDGSAGNPFPAYYPSGFGDLLKVIYRVDAPTTDPTLRITLTADAGYLATLEGFDLAAINGSANNLDLLEVIVDGTPHILGTNIAVPNTSGTHASYDFSTAPYRGTTVVILLDGRDTTPYGGNATLAARNLEDMGIDNIAFGQEVIPEPSTVLLAGLGALLVASQRRRARA